MTDVTQGNGGDTEPVKQRVAKHELLDAQGAVVENEEEAVGVRYTLTANNQTAEYKHGTNADVDRMLALFGAKTLMTNESSQARNNPKGDQGPDAQIAAVRDRFEFMLNTSKWLDRTRAGVETKIDLDALSDAIVTVQPSLDKAAVRQRVEEDKPYRLMAYRVPEVAAEYIKIVGRGNRKTVDDLMAGFTAPAAPPTEQPTA